VVAELHDKNAELLQQLDSMGLSHGVPGVFTMFLMAAACVHGVIQLRSRCRGQWRLTAGGAAG
jgi:hypothetical protein